MTLERTVRTRLASALILLLVLGSGFILGMAVDRTLDAQNASGDSTGLEPGVMAAEEASEEGGSSRRRSLIVEQVGLSSRQKTQVDSIVREFRTQMRDLHREFDQAYSARYGEIVNSTRDEIKGVLSEEQRMAYDSLLVEWDRRRKERRRDSASGSDSRRNRN